MNILIVTGIFPPDIGGPATYVPMIADALTVRGHRVTVVTLSDTTTENTGGYSFPVVRMKRWLWRPVRMLLTIATIVVHGRKADVLFVNGLALEAVLANYLLQKPLVQKIVGDLAWERARTAGLVTDNLEQFQTKCYTAGIELLKKLRAFWVRASTTVIVPSSYLQRIVAGWGVPEEKIEVVYNAIPPLPDNVRQSAQRSAPDQPLRTIVSVGRLVPWKGFEDLITVCASLPEVQLFIIGSGPCHDLLQQHIAVHHAHDRIHLVGGCSHEAVLSFLQHADLFVLNSRYEGLPHIVLEAMSAGVPVVATNVGGTAELVQDRYNGLLVDPDDPAELKKAIRAALDHQKLRETLIQNAKATVQRCSPDVLIEQTEQILATAVNRRKQVNADFRIQKIPRPSVLFLSTARFTTPPDQTLIKKWSGLQHVFDATVLSVHDGNGLVKKTFAGARLILLPAGINRFLSYGLYVLWATWYSMVGAVQKKYQVIIAQSPFQALAPALVLVVLRLWRRRSLPRLIIELHNDWTEGVMLYHPGRFSRLEKKCRMALGRFALRQADAYRVISNYCRSLVPDTGKPVFVFPTFTDLEHFAQPSPSCITSMQHRYGSGFFVSAGMLIELKGLEYLIRAFSDLLRSHPQARLIIAGKGRDEQRFKQLACELGANSRISFVGHLEQAELAGLVKNALAFVLPSLTEGLGRVAIEAQLLAKPVIASRVGGIPEIIEDGVTGILVPPADASALHRALRELFEHPEKAELMGKEGQQAVKKKFDYSGYFQSYRDMVEKVCNL